jgi:hypothetical protein
MNTAIAPVTTASDAPLPVKYEAARRAIAECDQIDECKTWSDRAAALSAYAVQARDDSLRVMAVRIQARAYRRMGELLKQIPRGDEATRYGHVGTDSPVTRASTAKEAGLSERQRNTALRIASVPEADFNRDVETPTPPTISQLAAQGTVQRSASQNRTPLENSAPHVGPPGVARKPEATNACQELLRFADFCKATEPRNISEDLEPQSAQTLVRCVELIDAWLDQFIASLTRVDKS